MQLLTTLCFLLIYFHTSGGKNEQNKFHDSLTPATIKQLYDATKNNPNDDSVQIDNNPVKTVVIMGIATLFTTHLTYLFI